MMEPQSYLEQLNEQQRDAVEYLGGPELVIAGAGSGKTRVLTYKIVHLLARGYEPWRILALTFTNKAAREMRERIEDVAGIDTARRLWMGTFHSIFARLLRRHAAEIGYSPRFTIYDTSDSRSLIKSIIRDMDLDEKVYKPATIQNVISWAKNSLLSPDAYASDIELMKSDERGRRPRTSAIYRAYVARCRVSDAMDFDDLLYYTAILLRDNPGILGHYREFFKYILVDEFQDTNFAQNTIITMLGTPAGNVCVVGDDAQSIYSFRGANIDNILKMERSFPTIRTFKLERNYRSTKNITGAANSLIAKNLNRIPKEVFSLADEGARVEVQGGQSDYDEAGLVAAAIVQRRAISGDPYAEFSILYRTNAQSRVLEEALRRRDIPYRIYGGQAFYQRKEVKDALAYFHLSVNPDDDESLKRVINVPARGIGKVTIEKLVSAAIAADVSIWKVLLAPVRYGLNVNSGTLRKLEGFVTLVKRFVEMQTGGTDVYALALAIVRETRLMAMYASEYTPENISKRENVEELLKSTHEYVRDRIEAGEESGFGMADFLTEVSLATDQDIDADTDAVNLMTIHSAKGLEFNNVYVVGVEEDLLPSSLSHDSATAVEEERRLFYVAITRARKFCMLSYANSRYLNGQTCICKPSRFLADIDRQWLKFSLGSERLPYEMSFGRPVVPRTSVTPHSSAAPRTTASSDTLTRISAAAPPPRTQPAPADGFAIRSAAELQVGMEIEHRKFGRGCVESVDTTDLGDMAMVTFRSSGTRKILLKYAQIRIP